MEPYKLCEKCGHLLTPIYYEDKKVFVKNGNRIEKNMLRCSYLVCEDCGSRECVDNSFDKLM